PLNAAKRARNGTGTMEKCRYAIRFEFRISRDSLPELTQRVDRVRRPTWCDASKCGKEVEKSKKADRSPAGTDRTGRGLRSFANPPKHGGDDFPRLFRSDGERSILRIFRDKNFRTVVAMEAGNGKSHIFVPGNDDFPVQLTQVNT